MSISPACKRENCTTIGWHVHRDVDSLSERITRFRGDRQGLPPKLHVELDCFEDQMLEACITDEHTDILLTAGTGIKNDGTPAAAQMAHGTPDYRIAEILVAGYNDGPALLTECRAEIARLTDRVQLFEDAKYPEEIARLKTQLERAEALLRRSYDRTVGPAESEIAAYFQEKGQS